MPVVAVRLLADTALVGLLLFGAAGTLAWTRAWVLLAVLLLVRAIGAVLVARVHPALLRERAKLPMHAAQPWSDLVLVWAVLATGFLGLPLIAGFDVFRWHVRPQPGVVLSAVGLVLFALGWSLKQLALRTNAFATVVVRHQHERAHVVVDGGVYALVRHPSYAADPLIFLGLSLWLQSYVAALGAVIPVALMVRRLQLEERFLRNTFPAYQVYMARVPYRLVPGIW